MHPYPRHLTGFDYVGPYRYSLTICTYDRQPLFTNSVAVEFVATQILRIAAESGFADLAHCFMPDHLHAVVEGRTETADLKAFVARAKQQTAFYFRKRFGLRLWQRYSWERLLRRNDSTQAAIRYVIENPIRAGLVTAVADYPFIGSSEYTLDELIEFCTSDPSSFRL